MLYFDARLSEANPTVEVRTTDVCTDPDDAVLIAALVRGLVMRLADGRQTAAPGAGLADRAAAARRTGGRLATGCPTGCCARPRSSLIPAREVLSSLFATVRDQLEACGDVDTRRGRAGAGAGRRRRESPARGVRAQRRRPRLRWSTTSSSAPTRAGTRERCLSRGQTGRHPRRDTTELGRRQLAWACG